MAVPSGSRSRRVLSDTLITSRRRAHRRASSAGLLSAKQVEQELDALIAEADLTPATNRFLVSARGHESIEPGRALYIAHNWTAVTKVFMLSTIAGLGVMANEATVDGTEPRNLLRVMQTVFRVIGDDLANIHPPFKHAAPAGTAGIHYIWWHDSIVRRLRASCAGLRTDAHMVTSSAAARLVRGMRAVTQSSIGTVVQIRVVEGIAFDIALAFRRIFSRVTIERHEAFDGRGELAWLDTHIRAERLHREQVAGKSSGVAILADTIVTQQEMLVSARRYARLWGELLDDFAAALWDARAGRTD